MDGFLNLLKPPGMTSSDMVLFVRRLLPRGTRVGHGGTLDPDAAGVLPICVGRAARLFDYIIDKKKSYIAELRLGITTDTQDATGRIQKRMPVCASAEDVQAVLPHFVGEIMQVPPGFSAIKRDGKRLYELARKGEQIEVSARPVRVDALCYLGQVSEDRHLLKIECGKGLYVRTLLQDIGNALGEGGHMSFLLRSGAGVFALESALTPEELLAAQHSIHALLIPMDVPLSHMPRVDVGADHEKAVRNGNAIRPEWLDAVLKTDVPFERCRVYLGGVFCGIGECQPEGSIRFRAMLLQEGSAS